MPEGSSLLTASSRGVRLLLLAILPWTAQSFGAHLRRRPWETATGNTHAQAGGGEDADVLILLENVQHGGIAILHGALLTSSSPFQARRMHHLRTKPTNLKQLFGKASTALRMSKSGGDEGDESLNTTTTSAHHQSISTPFPSSSSVQQSNPSAVSGSDASDPARESQFDAVSWSLRRPQSPNKAEKRDNDRLTRVNGAEYVPAPTVRSSLRPLWKMTRPENFPGIVLFHLVGVFLAARNLAETSHYRHLIFHPGLITTLLSLLLTSSASMVVNDYYDAKLGRDAYKLHTSAVTGLPLLKGDVPLPVARRFLSYLYGASLLVLALVPGIPTRLSIVMGLMITYFYTQSLKPICWVKNAVCASLIALAPLTSGTATVHLLRTGRQAFELSLSIVPLWRLVAVLFFGVFGREVMMDCNDSDADRRAGIMTIPVLHGRRYAAQVALLSNTVMALSATSGPLWHLVCRDGSSIASARRLVLASVGSALAIRRGYQVLKTGGAEKVVIEGAVDEGLITVLFFLASFV